MRRLVALLAFLGLGLLATPASGAPSRAFEGRCEIAGPIVPEDPINVFPRLGARFSFHGKGTCDGTLRNQVREGLRARLDAHRAQTPFDSCELGPDLGIPVTLAIRRAPRRWLRYPLTLELARIATFGPFLLHGAGGGWAHGTAELVPADLNQALAECGDPAGGIRAADLVAAFETGSPLVAS